MPYKDHDKHLEHGRAYYAKNREAMREQDRLNKYGLTGEQHQEMLNAQNGRCAVCDVEPGSRALDVDHCHDTGAVRGLLCNACNVALARAKDSPTLLRDLASYVER